MKKATIIGLAVLGGLSMFGYGIYYYFKKQADLLKQFSYKIINLNFDTFELNLIKGTITFRFTSISDIELTVQDFLMKLYFNGEYVGYVEDVSAFLIPARGYNDIPFAFSINPQLIISDVTDIIAYAFQSKDGTITLDGYATVKSGFIKATLPIKFNCSVKNMDCNQIP